MDQLLKFINNLNVAQRAIIIGGFSLLFILLVGLLVYSNTKAQSKKLNYTIASNLTKNQVMLASTELEASGIEFLVIGNGNNLTLKTSKEFINIAKIKLVTSDAATSKHVGWEIFEKSSLGTTNFENKVKYLRALEGELSRSLESLSGILRASVKIAIPKDTIFTQKKAKPTASAIISLKSGVFLTQNQINGIKNFIASAVTKLDENDINLIDQNGTLLENSKNENDNIKSNTQNKYKEKIEKKYENKIVELLEPFVGINKVVARVSIEFNFINRHIQEEIYEPEGTIRSQQTTENTSSSQGKDKVSGGTAGVDNNIEEPDENKNAPTNQSSSENSKNIINYEISKKIIEEKNNNYSTIKRITAAVTFDSTVLKNEENTEQFLSSIETLVQNSIGYNKKRGDKVSVKNFTFLVANSSNNKQTISKDGKIIIQNDEEQTSDTLTMIKSILQEFGEYIQYLIAIILLFIFYKKFIVNHEVVILGNNKTKNTNKDNDDAVDEFMSGLEDNFDFTTAQGRLKAKIKSQILNNIEGLDEESAAKYEVLIEAIDKEISSSPEEIAKMIELLLSEGNTKFSKVANNDK